MAYLRRLRWALGTTLAIGFALASFLAWQTSEARSDLNRFAAELADAKRAARDFNTPAAHDHAEKAAMAARSARGHTHGLLWQPLDKLPYLGDDVYALQTVTDVADILSQDALTRAIDATSKVTPDQLAPTAGRLDATPLTEAIPELTSAQSLVEEQSNRLNQIDTSTLTRPMRSRFTKARDQLNEVSTTVTQARDIARIGSHLFDSDQPRNVLMSFVTNSQARSTGGMPGAFATMRVKQGIISFGDQRVPADFPFAEDPVAELDLAEQTLWSDKMVRYPQNTNFTPDFSRAASFLATMWEKKFEPVDAVLQIDPVALGYLMEGQDPITIGPLSFNADTAAKVLLHDVYQLVPDPQKQNELFGEIAEIVFRRISEGEVSGQALYNGLERAVRERRVLLYLKDSALEESIKYTKVGGALNFAEDETPRVTVAFNDATGAKLQWFLDYKVDVRATECSNDRAIFDLLVALDSNVPNPPDELSPSQLGLAQQAPRGWIVTQVNVIAPHGSAIEDITIPGGNPVDFRSELDGRPMSGLHTYMEPGQHMEIHYKIVGAKGQRGDPELWVGPGAQQLGIGEVASSPCAGESDDE